MEEEDQETDELQGEDPFGLLGRSFGRQETEQLWPSWGLTGPGVCRPSTMEAVQAPLAASIVSPTLASWAQLQQQLVEASSLTTLPSAAKVAALHFGACEPPPAQGTGALLPPPEWAHTTTVMMRNLPNKYTQLMLLEELNRSGFLGTFDFMYLPIDPETNANRGYAFINFIDSGSAWMLKMTYEGCKMNCFNSDKVVTVAAAALQGFEANHAHYSTSRVNRGDPAARPLFLRQSSLQAAKSEGGGRRRGGRRSSGSLIDLAAKLQQQGSQPRTQLQMRRQTLQEQRPQAFEKALAALPPQLEALSLASEPGTAGVHPAAVPFSAQRAAPCLARAAEEPRLKPKFCPFCGGKVQPEFKFCQFCGSSLNISGTLGT